MCGIAGFLDPGASLGVEALSERARMLAAMVAHRGPDDAGVWVDAPVGVGLGHQRLAIIDTSPLGHQPMLSRSGRWVITYNGEIYNFGELRGMLDKQGVTFRGGSDTEVLVEAIDAWGLDRTLEQLNGMFAFAAWDREQRKLFLVRDRIGEKPLYYGRVGSAVVFGSELKAIRAYPGFTGELDRGAVALFLRYGYVPAPHSIYQGIFKLPPGCVVQVDASGSVGEPRAYWSLRQVVQEALTDPFTGDATEAAEELDRLIKHSVKIRMIADVPLGAFLSGGVDSSTVVAAMQSNTSIPVRTFTIGFTDPTYDEAPHARAIAHHLNTNHTERYVTPTEAMEILPDLPTLYDEPFADSSQIPTSIVARLAREHVTVCLSGDGGDELFGGYDRYWLGRSAWRKLRVAPWTLRRSMLPAISWLAGRNGAEAAFLPASPNGSPWNSRFRRLSTILSRRGPSDLYDYFLSQWQRSDRFVLGRPAIDDVIPAIPSGLRSFEAQAMYRDQLTYLPDDILMKVDRATMGTSLESRIPLLDPRIIRFAASLPPAFKMHGPGGKWLLRQVLHRSVPRELIERPKQGFGVPIGDWIRSSLRDWAEDLLSGDRLTADGLLDPAPVRTSWEQHVAGSHDHTTGIWTVLMLNAWLEATRRENRPARADIGARL
jgi:asparagine synthase (glutamine-hydrolysing)